MNNTMALSAGVKRLGRCIVTSEQLARRLAALKRARGEVLPKLERATATLDATNFNSLRIAKNHEEHMGGIESQIGEVNRKIAEANAGMQMTLADCAEHYGQIVSPRIQKLSEHIAERLAPYYRGESKPLAVATASDAIAYLTGHLASTSRWPDRCDTESAKWVKAACERVLGNPAAPWPANPPMPQQQPQPEESEAVAA
jgi:hypothetical protein